MIPEQYIGLNCELETFKNAPLLTAIVQNANENGVLLGDMKVIDPVLLGKAPVKLCVHISDKEERIFKGKIDYITSNSVYLKEIVPLDHYGKRQSFRVKIDLPAQAYQMPEDSEQEMPENSEQEDILLGPFPVRIKDISLSGMLLEAVNRFPLEANLHIKSNFPGIGRQEFSAQVKREQKTRLGYAYGVNFVNLENWQEEKLCQFVFKEQRDEIRRRQGNSDRRW